MNFEEESKKRRYPSEQEQNILKSYIRIWNSRTDPTEKKSVIDHTKDKLNQILGREEWTHVKVRKWFTNNGKKYLNAMPIVPMMPIPPQNSFIQVPQKKYVSKEDNFTHTEPPHESADFDAPVLNISCNMTQEEFNEQKGKLYQQLSDIRKKLKSHNLTINELTELEKEHYSTILLFEQLFIPKIESARAIDIQAVLTEHPLGSLQCPSYTTVNINKALPNIMLETTFVSSGEYSEVPRDFVVEESVTKEYKPLFYGTSKLFEIPAEDIVCFDIKNMMLAMVTGTNEKKDFSLSVFRLVINDSVTQELIYRIPLHFVTVSEVIIYQGAIWILAGTILAKINLSGDSSNMITTTKPCSQRIACMCPYNDAMLYAAGASVFICTTNNPQDSRCLSTISGPLIKNPAISHIIVIKNLIYLSFYNYPIIYVITISGAIYKKLIGHTHDICCMKQFYGSDKCPLVTLSDDRSIRMWNTEKADVGCVVATDMEDFTAFECSGYKDCTVCFAGTESGIIRSWVFYGRIRKATFRMLNRDFRPIKIIFDSDSMSLIVVQKMQKTCIAAQTSNDKICIYKLLQKE